MYCRIQEMNVSKELSLSRQLLVLSDEHVEHIE